MPSRKKQRQQAPRKKPRTLQYTVYVILGVFMALAFIITAIR
jgi:hypothetical protein